MLRDVLVHPGDIIDAVESPRDPGLVRHHGNRDAGPVEPGDGLGRTLDELHAVNRADVAMVNDDRAVAIEKDPGSSASTAAPGVDGPGRVT